MLVLQVFFLLKMTAKFRPSKVAQNTDKIENFTISNQYLAIFRKKYKVHKSYVVWQTASLPMTLN